MIYTYPGEQLAQQIAIAKAAKVPLLVDGAAGIPPIDNIKLYAKMGADLYTFSGRAMSAWANGESSYKAG